MKKVLSFSLFLIIGLIASQILPNLMGVESYSSSISSVATPLLYICLSFIMINVGREFEVNKKKWRSYTQDYFVAMATAALPWILVALYFIFFLMPSEFWGDSQAWKENLLLSRFAAPTSAGILFTMLVAMNLKNSWIYKKIQVLAIFDDLDTILLMIPLQIMMIGMKWQMVVVVTVIFLLLVFGWRKLDSYKIRQDWKAILVYSVLVYLATLVVYTLTKRIDPAGGGVHIEVLLPAFVLGMVIKHKENDTLNERRVSSGISTMFMFLVGLSMPLVVGPALSSVVPAASSILAQLPMLPWGEIAIHVLIVSLISNIGKLIPIFFYRDRKFSERLAVAVGMFTRGEVGAGVIFIAISYNVGGNALIVSALTLVLNLVLTGGFVVWVRHLAKRSYGENSCS